MFQKKMNIRILCTLLLLTLLLLLVSSCGKKEDKGSKTTTGTQPAKEESKTPAGPKPFNPFIPSFEEQLIYDKDGISVKVKVDEKGDGEAVEKSDRILLFTVKNGTKQTIKPSCISMDLPDGYRFLVHHQMIDIKPNAEQEYTLLFRREVRMDPPMGSYTFFQDHGLGKTLGNFRLNFLVLDEKAKKLSAFSTDTIKTEKTGTHPNYSGMRKKPLLLNQNGLEIRYVSNFIIPKNPKENWTKDTSVLVMFYENTLDKSYSLIYKKALFNDKEVEKLSLPHGEVVAHGKGFLFFFFDNEDLEKNGVFPLKKFSVVVSGFKKKLDDKDEAEYLYTAKPITIKFSKPWSVLK